MFRYVLIAVVASCYVDTGRSVQQPDEWEQRVQRITRFWMNRVTDVETPFQELLEGRPKSAKALKENLVPYFRDYVAKYHQNVAMKQKVLTALRYLERCGPDSESAQKVLRDVAKKTRDADIASATRRALTAIRSVTLVGEITNADPVQRVIHFRSKDGQTWRLKVPEHVRISAQTLRGLVQVTFDRSDRIVSQVRPVEF